jgi:hypothetical protein
MALQINRTLTTQSGFSVSTGSYVWVFERRGTDRLYKVEADIKFYKDKASFDLRKSHFNPSELSSNDYHFEMELSPTAYRDLTSLAVQTYVKNQLEIILGAGTITIVQ